MRFDYPLVFNVLRLAVVVGRCAGFYMAMPPFNSAGVNVRFRVLLSLATAAAIWPVLPADWGAALAPGIVTVPFLVCVMVAEALLGVVVALAVRLFLETFALAGEQIAREMGFSMAMDFDPTLEQQNSLIGNLLLQAFVMVMLIHGVQYDLVRLAAASFETVGPGGYVLTAGIGETIHALAGGMFLTAFQISLPMAFTILFINIAMAMLTKFAAEFEVLMLAFPVRIGTGFLVLTAGLGVLLTINASMCVQLVDRLRQLLGH